MAFLDGDMVIPAAVFPMDVSGLAHPELGTLTTGKVLFGTVSAGAGSCVWNNGLQTLLSDGQGLRMVQAASGSEGPFFAGTSAYVTAQPNLRGVIVAAIEVELGTTGKTGPLTACSLIRTASGREIIVPNSSLTSI